jgi:hypothetical protein
MYIQDGIAQKAFQVDIQHLIWSSQSQSAK